MLSVSRMRQAQDEHFHECRRLPGMRQYQSSSIALSTCIDFVAGRPNWQEKRDYLSVRMDYDNEPRGARAEKTKASQRSAAIADDRPPQPPDGVHMMKLSLELIDQEELAPKPLLNPI